MKINMGNADRFTRIMIGIILLIVVVSGVIENKYIAWPIFAISSILIITAFAKFCPLYAIIGKSTCETKKK